MADAGCAPWQRNTHTHPHTLQSFEANIRSNVSVLLPLVENQTFWVSGVRVRDRNFVRTRRLTTSLIAAHAS